MTSDFIFTVDVVEADVDDLEVSVDIHPDESDLKVFFVGFHHFLVGNHNLGYKLSLSVK